MIRERFDIDNKLILDFIRENKYDNSIEEGIVKWYALLGDKDFEKGRMQAIKVLQSIAKEALLEINFPDKEKENLVTVFNPLESILRTALSLNSNQEKNNIKVRDHLNHSIRNLLFASFLIKYFHTDVNSIQQLKRQICIAAIFHDIGYPIQKLKKIGNNLKDGAFRDLLNSSGKIDFILDKPDDLLEIMDFFGKLANNLEINGPEIDKDRLLKKIKHIYQRIITPAIAGQGLFNSPHNLSSVILFLRPILKNWKESQIYLQMKIETICDICLAIAYHDRDMPFENFEIYNSDIPLITKIIRIADELQEWDRVRCEESFVKDVEIDTSNTNFSITFIMKNSSLIPCDPLKFIPDKILGLAPIIDSDIVILTIVFPTETLIEKFEKLKTNDIIIKYNDGEIKGKPEKKTVVMTFNKLKVKIELI